MTSATMETPPVEEVPVEDLAAGTPVLVLLPVVGQPAIYRWVGGYTTGTNTGGFAIWASGGDDAPRLDVVAQGITWRGCSSLCVLPCDAPEEQQQARLQEVLRWGRGDRNAER